MPSFAVNVVIASATVLAAQYGLEAWSAQGQAAPPAPTSQTVTVQGCLQPTSALNSFALVNARMPAGSIGSTAPADPPSSLPPAPAIYLLHADAGKLSPHEGQKVEVVGRLDATSNERISSGGDATDAVTAPLLQVETVRTIASKCIP